MPSHACKHQDAVEWPTQSLTKNSKTTAVRNKSALTLIAETYNQAATVKVLGAAGLGLSLASSTFASTIPAAGIPQSDNTSPNQRFVLGEEEMADVSLTTFHLFDKENFGSGVQLARGCGVRVR